jgi:pimeloyl-[acyl-carrier protein] methyl ester esterase
VNTTLHCERSPTSSDAAPLVCVHGWGMNLRAFDPLREALRPGSTWALDLPGHGRSDWHDARAPLELQLEDLQAVLPEHCVLVGWSLGGQLALELARRAPRQVVALVLIASTPRFTQAPDWPQGSSAETLRAFEASLTLDWRQCLRDFVQLQVRGGRNAAATRQQLDVALEAHGVPRTAALHAGLAMLGTLDQRAALGQILQPALVLSGENDRVTAPQAGRWMADALPHARHVQIARAGHAPLLSHVDEVAVAIREFLRV